MKLLFVIPEYPPQCGGGISTYYRALLPAIAQKGHEVHVLVSSAFVQTFPSHTQNGVHVESVDSGAVTECAKRFSAYAAFPLLQRHLAAAWVAWDRAKEGQGYDVVETTDWGLLFGPWVTCLKSPPVVVQLHGSIGQIDVREPSLSHAMAGHYVRLLEVAGLAAADCLQTYGQGNADNWNEMIGREIEVIWPAFESPVATSTVINREGFGLVVGRVQPWKGPRTLCRALALMGQDAPQIRWVGRDTQTAAVGGSLSASLSREFSGIWGKRLIPEGACAPEKVAQLQARAKFVVVPSSWDVYNLATAEAMASGSVVLCSSGAGASHLIEDGIDGFTFKSDEPEDLARGLHRVVSLTDDERERIGRRARIVVAERLSPAVIVTQRMVAYERVMNAGRREKPNQWLNYAVACSDQLGPNEDKMLFLEGLPLRALLRHCYRRLKRKLSLR